MREKQLGIRIVLTVIAAAGLANAQTLVNLGVQSKNIDFTGMPSTRPVKTAITLPGQCSLGELLFDTAAAAGANLYACVSANTWAVQSSGGGGALTVRADGTSVGTRPILNIVPGLGIINAISDTGDQIVFQQFTDTAVLLTKSVAQSGSVASCNSTSGSGAAYTCVMSPTLGSYGTGMVLSWIPDVNGTGGATTLNIDTLGGKAVKLTDGVTNPTALDIVSGTLHSVWYDGTQFRLLTSPALAGSTGATQPACALGLRGRLWYLPRATGLADKLQVCAKNASDAYAWSDLF